MTHEFLKLVYKNLKNQFDGISKKSWIWIDFFDDEEAGLDYLKEEIEGDADFSYLKENCDIDEELAFDVALEISSKLRKNDFFVMCEQFMLEQR